jgi:RNA polymerase sigma-70 factor (ECF subfamily)
VLALLVVRTRRLDLVEDALAEAFARAATRWPSDGVPTDPPAWLYTTAHRVLLGRLRADAVAGRRAPLLAVRAGESTALDSNSSDEGLPDERLQMILLCCHPALEPASRSALALRLVVGTSTAEIARLFLVSVPTMAARITRAKRKIAVAGIPLGLPLGRELDERFDAVARTIYLAFTAGYTPGVGPELLRADLAGEAVRLAEVLLHVAPAAPQARALLALLLFQHSRREARVADGRLITLAEQDRTRWHTEEIDFADGLLRSLPAGTGYSEELRLQAAAAREHAIAATSDDTDWAAIVSCYSDLLALTGSPVVALNRAVALAEIDGPQAALESLAAVAPQLESQHRFHAVRADLLARVGDAPAARMAYLEAIERCGNETELAFLQARVAGLADCEVRPQPS